MGTTVIVNYMTASHQGSGGKSPCFPDVCKTPSPAGPIPIPYPNIAQSSDLSGGSKKVKFDGEPVVLKSSKISRSMGDEAGTAGGVVSSVNMGKAQFVNYSFDVKVEGANVGRLSDPTTQNMSSVNAAGFFHLQAPGAAVATEGDIVQEACERIRKSATQQANQATPQSQFDSSGIISRHRSAIQRYVDKKGEWMLYFRKTNDLCRPWIEDNHAPKPHACTAGKTIKPDKVPVVHRWLRGHRDSKEYDKSNGDAGTLLGVVMSTLSAEKGKPMLGCGQFKKKWMTGDYDLMDVLRTGARCDRPKDGHAFEALQHELNQAMRWPGIQHGPQSLWDTKTDELPFQGPEHFNVTDILDKWAHTDRASASTDIPARVIAEGRDPLAMVDKELSVIAPKCSMTLDKHEDYWDALACCGCRDDAASSPPPKTPAT